MVIQSLTPQKMKNKNLVNFWYRVILTYFVYKNLKNDSKIETNNCVLYNKPRSFIHKKAKRNSSEIVVFIKESLNKGIQLTLSEL